VTNEDETEIAKLFAARFIERRDVCAIQSPRSGAYAPYRIGFQTKYEDRPLMQFNLERLREHVRGDKTFGHYLLKPETSTCRMFCFDIDFNEKSSYYPNGPEHPVEIINPREIWSGPTTLAKRDLALQLFAMARGLAVRTWKTCGIQVIVSYSGNKGAHVIGCLEAGTPAKEARELAQTVLDSCGVFEPLKGHHFWKHSIGYPSLEIEVFPKQDEVSADGFGNLLRLPLGINRKSGKPGFFVRMDTELGDFKIDDPLTVLTKGSIRDR